MSFNLKKLLSTAAVLLLTLVMLTASVSMAGCSSRQTDEGIIIPSGMKIMSEGDGYVCFVPTDWKLGNRFGVDYAYLDFQYCTITLSVTDTEKTSVSEIFAESLAELRAASADFELLCPEKGETAELGSDTDYKYAATSYTYSMTVDGVKNKYRQCMAIREGTLFIITYCARVENVYDEYADAFANVLADFTFSDAAKGSAAAPVTPPSAEGVTLPAGMKLSSDTNYTDYLLFVPDSWIITSCDGLSAAAAPSDPRVTVNVTANSLGTVESMKVYFDQYLERLGNNVTELNVIERYEITNKSETETDKILYLNSTSPNKKAGAFRYVFTCKWMGTEYKFTQYAAISASKLHLITLSAPAEQYESHSAEFNKIIEEFKFD